MSCSEIINIGVSVASVLIALLALFQTKRQISLSNKQQLFERRLSRYLEFNTIYHLYNENKLYLNDDSTFYHTNSLIFSWLTNCSDLEKMALALSNPLHQDEQKVFLSKHEQLKSSAVEISMIFDSKIAILSEEFISLFADLLKAMYQQQVYISKLREQEQKDGKPQILENYESNCKKMAESLGIFQIRDKLEKLSEEIVCKQIIEKMKKSIRLTKVKRC